jgi:hypothetical protein
VIRAIHGILKKMNEKLDQDKEWIGLPLLHQLASCVIIFLSKTSNGTAIEEDDTQFYAYTFEETRNELVSIKNISKKI